MKHTITNPAQLLLGQRLEALRLHKGVTRKQLGRTVKVTEQQIAKYEAGAFVPMAMLEHLTKTLGEPIEKRLIRRISALRKYEQDSGELPPELIDLYDEAIPLPQEHP